jgi:3-oxoacyl-[acyl-carrier-protein] synthase-3
MRAVVQSIGHAVPARVVSNDEIAAMVDTTDEWIVQRTGIKRRRVVVPGESTGMLSIAASREALERAGVDGSSIDLVLCATVSGDYVWPATACGVQDAIGASAAAFDVSAACAGFIYAMDVAASFLETGRSRRALVIGVDTLSRQVDWTDRATCVLFGDGAGAAVMEAADDADRGLIASVLFSDGSGAPHIRIQGGGSIYPHSEPWPEGVRDKIEMNGKEVYRFAVHAMGDACEKVLAKAGMSAEEIDLFVPHQANIRIIDSAAKRLGLPEEKVFVNVDEYGNTSGGSVPLALYEAEVTGRLKRGMTVLTVGFGAGLVWGANIIRW